MARDPYDHGQEEVDCPNCAGKGQVVQPVPVWNHQTKETVIIQRADYCQGCGGSGKVWM